MKIIKALSDGTVLFAGTNLFLDQNGCGGIGWRSRVVDTSIATIEPVNSLPAGFIPGGWIYVDGVWTSNSLGADLITDDNRTKKLAGLQSAATAAVYADITHAGQTWRADKESRDLLADVLSAGSVPAEMYWRDAAGTPHAMTYADLQALARAILDRGLLIDANLITKSAAANAATTAAEIDAVAW